MKSTTSDEKLTVINFHVDKSTHKLPFAICGDYLCWLKPDADCTILYQELNEFTKDGKPEFTST